MKQTSKITFSGITAALAVVIMLTSYFPWLTYAIPAVAGLCMIMPVIESGCSWAFGAYLASVLPVFLFSEPEAKLLYVAFFGYYPILKAVIDRKCPKAFAWPLKLVVFNAAVLLVYLVLVPALGINIDDFGEFEKYGLYAFWAAANVVFVFYDIAVSQAAGFYMARLHANIKKYLK